MAIVLAQLSDIHLKSSTDPVASRVVQIAAAIASATVKPSLCVLVLSGDLAHSGTEAQFKAFALFLRKLRDELRKLDSQMKVETIMVPGNHDCDFSTAPQSRELVLAGL